jgi:hypothetical protein
MDSRVIRIIKQSIDLNDISRILADDLNKVIEVSNQRMKELKEGPESVFLAEQETWFRLSNGITVTTIESICFKLKQIALLSCDILGRPLKSRQREMLEERRANGRPFYIPTDDNLKFTFKMYAYAFESGYKLDCNGKEWADFLEIVDKRNALTHPKTKADLKISVKEHDKAADVSLWFIRVFQELMRDCRTTGKKVAILFTKRKIRVPNM